MTTMSALAKRGQDVRLALPSDALEIMPDLPTIAETVPGYEVTIWLGVMAPKVPLRRSSLSSIQTSTMSSISLKLRQLGSSRRDSVGEYAEEFDAFLRKTSKNGRMW